MIDSASKLWKVTLRGMQSTYGTSYVVATDATSAYNKVRKYLDDKNLGFTNDRAFNVVTLIAESSEYPSNECILHL